MLSSLLINDDDDGNASPPSPVRSPASLFCSDHDGLADFDHTAANEDDFIEDELLQGLSDEEIQQYLSAPPTIDKWTDHSSFDYPTFVTMDEAKSKQWKLAKLEITHIRKQILQLLSKRSFDDVTKKDILFYLLGPTSAAGTFLRKELNLSEEKYLKFMSIICIQGA